MFFTKAYAAQSSTTPLVPFELYRRSLKDNDVHIEILYCGICHSDIHQVRNEWGGSMYPMVPGHEIVGKVIAIGNKVEKFKIGETVGVGVMIDSCRQCKNCINDLEQYCIEGMTGTYNAIERDGKTIAQGGYSSQIVVNEHCVLHIADTLPLNAVAPLLCAGITTYSPLRYANVDHTTKVGVIGLGGLGHMAVKFAVAFGAQVTVISTSPDKEADAKKLGAHQFIYSKDEEQMKKYKSYFNVLLDAVSANHNYSKYLDLLDIDGKMMVVGLPQTSPNISPFSLISNRRSITGSMIGGMKETQEMLDFCAQHHIVADVEVIPIQKVNEAYERMLKGDIKYRFVIDIASLNEK